MSKAGSRTGGYIWIVGLVVALVVGAMVVIGILIALLSSATTRAREAARTIDSMNHMRQIGLGMAIYEMNKQALPARAIFDKNGKALLSWRVRLLPLIDETELYKQFHLGESWDSPHNRTLIGRMPQLYCNPNRPKDGKTNYLVPVGAGTAFDGHKGITVSDFSGWLATTVMLVEADEDRAVIWTKPDDLDVDFDQPLNGLGHFRPAGIIAAFCDGLVHKIPATIRPDIMKALFARAGDKKIPSGITN